MYITKKEKEALLELTDVMSDRCPRASIDRFDSNYYRSIFYDVYKKLRFDIKGY